MGKVLIDKDEQFTSIGNTLLWDKEVSIKAKGMAALIFSLGNGWEISIERLMAYSKDGRDSVRSAVLELEEKGYLQRERARGSEGFLLDMNYRISNFPKFARPVQEKPTQDVPTNNKEYSIYPNSFDKDSIDISTPLRSVDNHMTTSENPEGIQDSAEEGFKAKKSSAKVTRNEVERVLKEEGLDASEELVDAIWGWKESRDRLKRPLTDRGLTLAIRKAKKIYLENPSHPISEIFDTSTQNGWVGIFPVRTEYANGLTDRDYAKARLWGKGLDHQEGYTFTAEKGEL